jgi:serine/threonine protein kinase
MVIGQRLGPYTIRSLIGAGGMGEVYRAHDDRLSRDIAIKILPAALTNDADRLVRFERESRILASLNHPNIAAIYGVEDASAAPNGTPPVRALLLELVEGETLAEWIARTRARPAVRVEEALNIARQIAAALDAAHEKGIVHRDLKPANVKITADGVVKVLDFGLAKSVPLTTAGPDSTTATAVSATTRDGQMLGTVPYMSPEQARGRDVDKRADIWAFGCVLFEMLAGQRAFRGETIPDVLAAILEREPSWNALPPAVPNAVRQLLRHCLEKDPKRRLRDIGDARFELAPLDHADAPADNGGKTARSRWRAPLLIASAAVIAIAGVIAWKWFFSGAPDTIWQPRPIATSSARKWDSRISPDGRWISYLSSAAGATQVMVKRIASGEVTAVALPAGSVLSQLWSPDGDQLAYVLRQGDASYLQVVGAFFGGVPAKSIALQPAPYDVRLLRWIGQTIYAECRIAGRTGRPLVRVDLATGTTTNLSDGWKFNGTISGYDVSPDGRKVVFAMSTKGQEDVWVANIDGTSADRLTNDSPFEHDPLWSREGNIIVTSNRGGQVDLWQIDLASGRFVRLTASETQEDPESTSADGTLVSFRQESENSTLWTTDPAADAISQLTDDTLSDFAPTAAANGGAVVFQRSAPPPLIGNPLLDSTLLFAAVDGSKFQSDPQTLGDGYAPLLSPDGSRVAYLQRSADAGHARLLVKQLRSGETMTLSSVCPQPAYSLALQAWSEQNLAWNGSGTELYFVERTHVYTVRRYRVGTNAPDAPIVTAEPNEEIHDLHPTADGRALAYLTSLSGRASVHLFDVEAGHNRWTVPFEGRVASARGWLPGSGGLVLARVTEFNADFSGSIEVAVASMAGVLRPIGVVDNAFVATTRLASARSALYVARTDNGIHNLYEFSLTTGRVRRLTQNALPAVTFSAVEPLGGGGLIVVRHERRSDIWLLESTSSSSGSPGAPRR